jgi:hypothetical protein
MVTRLAPVVSVALLVFGLAAEPAHAAPGDTVVPAHRTRSGAYVPANVPPMSAGTRLASRPGKGAKARAAADPVATTVFIPLFAEARPIRR